MQNIDDLRGVIECAGLDRLAMDALFPDVSAGLLRAPMALRVTDYVVSRIDWRNPIKDPLFLQFFPLGSRQMPDHPCAVRDPLAEQAHSPVRGVIHRYPDKALLITTQACPVYCRYCMRSYAIGPTTPAQDKLSTSLTAPEMGAALDYLRRTPAVEDVVISGGDASYLRPAQLAELGHALLDIPHIRRIRFASRGLAVDPQRMLDDHAWRNALFDVVARGRAQHKAVALHTHFCHPNEISEVTKNAANMLFEHGVTVRNQGVLLRGINDNARTLLTLTRELGRLNIMPYYMHQHDFVPGVEDLRTPLQTAIDLEKQLRGATAGFHTPLFAVDLPGGGGKRDVHSFESYNRTTGISVFLSPNCDATRRYLYFDPVHSLPAEGQAGWDNPEVWKAWVKEALAGK